MKPTTLFYNFLMLLSFQSTNGFLISFYKGRHCNNMRLGNVVLGPGEGCHTDAAGDAMAAVVSTTGPIDDTFYTVFFSSNDCNPDTVIAKSDGGCIEASYYSSFAVWNVCTEAMPDCLA